jgi:hypothetical protein
MSEDKTTLDNVTFVTDDTPFCVWDWELHGLETQFLAGIDPGYFAYMAQTHKAQLEGEEAQRSALALRMTYSHAQETLMSLLCALVQAPDCVIGWLHKYKNQDLEKVVEKLHHRHPVLTKLNLPALSWDSLSDLVHRSLSLEDKEKEARIKRGFGTFWSRIASEFLDEGGRQEYNSIKHGLRARSGGFQLKIGLETTPGTACPADQMKSIGGSEFGTTYYIPESIDGVEKCNIKIISSSRNWHPEQLAARIWLMSLSMGNILSFFNILNGSSPDTQQFSWDLEMFDTCWAYSMGATALSYNSVLESKHICPLTKQEILNRYQGNNESDQTPVTPS